MYLVGILASTGRYFLMYTPSCLIDFGVCSGQSMVGGFGDIDIEERTLSVFCPKATGLYTRKNCMCACVRVCVREMPVV